MTKGHKTGGTLQLCPVYTGEQIRAAEMPLLDAGHGPALMQRAAHGLAQQVTKVLVRSPRGRVYGAQVSGLIGSGNNGGDGLYALAYLARRGASARAVLVRENAHPEGLEEFLAAGGRLTESIPAGTEVLIDAILGTGFHGEFSTPEIPGLPELLKTHDDAATRTAPLIIACDLPSGVNADTGAAGPGVMRADHTVTFGGLKQGLLAGRGGSLSGQLHSVDIGLGHHLPKTLLWTTPLWCTADPAEHSAAQYNDVEQKARAPHLPGPSAQDHKYSRGVVHIVAGSQAYPGAAHLTAGAALNTGIGMVTLQAPAAVREQVIGSYPEVVGLPENSTPEAWGRASGVVIGPGIGEQPADLQRAESVLEQVLEAGTACVLDASGLSLIRAQLHRRGGLNKNVLITPHLGEARTLAATMRDQVLTHMLETNSAKSDPVEAARRIAGALDCTVLLKGATTVIASPQGEVALHRAQTPGLAAAGTGDVLSGILGALAARNAKLSDAKLPWWQVAALGAQKHSRAARQIDPAGLGHFGASQLLAALRFTGPAGHEPDR